MRRRRSSTAWSSAPARWWSLAPTDADAQMGPITTRAQFERVLGVYERARADRLDCLTGGAGGPKGGGFFVEPTIWADVPRDNPVWRSEIFGPALAVRTFTTRGRGARARRRQRLRPGRHGRQRRRRPRRAHRRAHRCRACLDQFGPDHLPQHRLGRLQGERHRPRARPLGPRRLSRRQASDHRRAGAAVKVAVIGAGVVGVATAYALARDGHEVVVVERREQAAMESSYGNAGLYSPSDSYAWASPDALKMAVRSLFNRDLGIQYKLRLDPALWLWSLKFLGQCTDAAARRNSLLKLRLTSYSSGAAEGGRAGDGRRLRQSPRGAAVLFRHGRMVSAAADHHMGLLRDHGLDLRVLDRDGVLATEPGLAADRRPDRGRHLFARLPDRQQPPVRQRARGLVRGAPRHRVPLRRDGSAACAATATGSPAWTPIGAGSWPTPMCSPRARTACSWRAAWAWRCRSIR